MAVSELLLNTDDIHPIDIVESLATHRAWDFDRISEEQIAMAIEGTWRTYSMTLAWSGHDETLRSLCTFDMDPPKKRWGELYRTLDKANDRVWTGAFTFWEDQKLMVYRYGLNLVGEATASAAQIDAIVQSSVTACERFYPAFQLVCWGGDRAEDALEIALAEAYGRA